jgi:hypothetical protein
VTETEHAVIDQNTRVAAKVVWVVLLALVAGLGAIVRFEVWRSRLEYSMRVGTYDRFTLQMAKDTESLRADKNPAYVPLASADFDAIHERQMRRIASLEGHHEDR